jgi:hypothetical protein
MPRTSFLAGLLLISSYTMAAGAEPKAVVELFTSQGCSSCRSADAFLAELADREDVIALSLHVDYWNYLGWEDTFSMPGHTERQRAYAEAHGSNRVFTPNIVVNGATDLVGSHTAAVEKAIAEASLQVPVSLRREDGLLKIEVGARPRPGAWRTTVRVVLFSSKASVEITRGENAGSSMIYRNVVKEMRPIGMWDGAPVKITLPEDELMGDGIDGCAVIVQEDLDNGPGAIVGAAQLDRW